MTTTPFAPVFEGVPAGSFVDLAFLEAGLERIGLGQFGALPQASDAVVEDARKLSEIIAGDRRSPSYDPQNLRRKLSELMQANPGFAVAVTRALGLVQQGLRPIGAEDGARRFGKFDPAIFLPHAGRTRSAEISATSGGTRRDRVSTSVLAQAQPDSPSNSAGGAGAGDLALQRARILNLIRTQSAQEVAVIENLRPPQEISAFATSRSGPRPHSGTVQWTQIDFEFAAWGLPWEATFAFHGDGQIRFSFSTEREVLGSSFEERRRTRTFLFEFSRNGKKFAELPIPFGFPNSWTTLPAGHPLSELFKQGVEGVMVRVVEVPLKPFPDLTNPLHVPLNVFFMREGMVIWRSPQAHYKAGETRGIYSVDFTVSSAGKVGVKAWHLHQPGRFYVDLGLARDGKITPVSTDTEGIFHNLPKGESGKYFSRDMTGAEKSALSRALGGNFGLLSGDSEAVELDRSVDIIATVRFVPEGQSSK